jgi:twitching motility protein PilT
VQVTTERTNNELTQVDYTTQPQTTGVRIDELLKLAVDRGASDLHLKVKSLPVLRIDGTLIRQEGFLPLTGEDMQGIFQQIAGPDQIMAYDREYELDFAYSVPGLARFRVSALQQRGTISLVFRLVPINTPSIDELQLPGILKKLILKPRGLILLTGPAGSGKSTTLAAMINHLNETESRSIITVEDPIEYLFRDDKCIIRQRDLGDDAVSFAKALAHALRHDPDVMVIGEMRDLDTAGIAITAAEAGHLVLATLHAVDAAQSIDRIIDLFPPAQQHQIRLQLSQVIEAVVSQVLLPRIGGGRVAALEIMLTNSVIQRLIREEKTHDIPSNIEMGKLEGMQTLSQALADLVDHNLVDRDEALAKSSNPARLWQLLRSKPETGHR